jgi:hypothetical protein
MRLGSRRKLTSNMDKRKRNSLETEQKGEKSGMCQRRSREVMMKADRI